MDPDITTPEDEALDPTTSATTTETPTDPAPAGEDDTPSSPEDEALLDPKDLVPETRQTRKPDPEPPAAPPPPAVDPDDNPSDSEAIGKIVDQKLGAMSEQLKEFQTIKDEIEIDTFLKTKPEYGRYRDVMVKYISHPAYAQIPVKNIAAIVAAQDMQKLGARKEREAAAKAKETQSPGSSVRKPTGSTDWSTVSKAEFEAQIAKIKGQA